METSEKEGLTRDNITIALWRLSQMRGEHFFNRFEEFLRKCLRKDSNPLKAKDWRRGGDSNPRYTF